MKEKIQKLILWHGHQIRKILAREATEDMIRIFRSWQSSADFDLCYSENDKKEKEIYSRLKFHQEAIWTLVELEKDSEIASHIKSLVKIWSK